MKKILSVALSTAMAFSMFASVAFGADATATTPDQKFDALKTAGIVNGLPDGLAHLEKTLTRAELAKIITKSLGLKEVTGVYTYKDNNYGPNHWAAPFIEAVTAAGIMQGSTTNGKQFFNPNGNVTAQELAIVLTRALKLEVPTTDVDNSAATWAKGEVQAAINAGLLDKSTTWTANATRSQAIVAAYAIWEAAQIPTVASYKVVDPSNVEFTLSTGEVVKVKLDKALEANVETPVEFKDAAGQTISTKVTYVVTDATKVASVAASNLKEVVVTFDGNVDADSAEDVANYSLKSGKTISNAVLSDDQKTVTLTLESNLTNNKADALTVTGIKAGTATVSASSVAFTPVDNTLPTVESVDSLGTKSVRVVFSEPVKNLTQSNFTLDGKTYYGKLDPSSNGRTVVLTPYTTNALAAGTHQLTVQQVTDYAGFVALAKTVDFTVVEDTTAPTITEATATLETVTLTFSEVVDPSTVTSSGVYWMSGTTKKYATGTPVRVADNKYKFTFDTTNNSLPTGAVTVYVAGVKDYSGNALASGTTVVVTPVVDQTRPEVTKVAATDSTHIKVTFSKAVYEGNVNSASNFTVTNADGKTVSVKSAAVDSTDPKSIIVTLYTDLSTGTNTIAVRNIKDTTKLQNTMLDYSGTVTVGDGDAPGIDSHTVNAAQRTVVVAFDEKMDIDSLTNYSNYLVTVDNKQQVLTSALADITPLQDGKSVAITFVDSFNNKPVVFGTGTAAQTSVTKLVLTAVKDLAGNVLDEFTRGTGGNEFTIDATAAALSVQDYSSDYATKKADVADTKTVKVKFSAPVVSVQSGAFSFVVSGVEQVASVDVDGSSVVTVNLKNDLKTDAADLDLDIDPTKIITAAGNAGLAGDAVTLNSANVIDSIAPVATTTSAYAVSGETIVVPFSEALQGNASVQLNASDFVVTRISDNKELVAGVDYTADVTGTGNNEVTITLTDTAARTQATGYRVAIKSDAKYITDLSVKKNAITGDENVSGPVAVVNP